MGRDIVCSHLDKLIRSPCSRSIQLTVGSDGTKTPRGEYNNWSLEQVLDNAGSGNTHMQHPCIPGLYTSSTSTRRSRAS